MNTTSKPRVWLVGTAPEPPDPDRLPTVRDIWLRTWRPGPDGRYHSADGWHHATWTELHSRYDLVEVA